MINQIDECFKIVGIRVPGMVRVGSVFVWLGADTVRPGLKVIVHNGGKHRMFGSIWEVTDH